VKNLVIAPKAVILDLTMSTDHQMALFYFGHAVCTAAPESETLSL